MSEKIIQSRAIQKHDTETNWLKATNFIPKQGEIIVYDIENRFTCRFSRCSVFISKCNFAVIYK